MSAKEPVYRNQETGLLKGNLSPKGKVFLVVWVKSEHIKAYMSIAVSSDMSEENKQEGFRMLKEKLIEKYKL